MGWRADGGLWLLVRGGGLYLSKGTGVVNTENFILVYQYDTSSFPFHSFSSGQSSFSYLVFLFTHFKSLWIIFSYVFYSLLVLSTKGILLLQITEEFEEVPVQSRGFGILDVGYRSTVMFLLHS